MIDTVLKDEEYKKVLRASKGMFRVIMHDKEGHVFPQLRVKKVPDGQGGFKHVSDDYLDLAMAIKVVDEYNSTRANDFCRFDVYNDLGEVIRL